MHIDRSSLLRVPRPYQDAAINRIIESPCVALWIDMGLGKTAIVLHALLEILFHSPGRVLLVAPLRVVETVWEQEAQEWWATRGLRFSRLRGTPKERKAAAEEDADIYLVNPELLEEALSLRKDYNILVIDETTIFKNPSTKRFKTLRKALKRFDRVVTATGSPQPNSLLDLWSQIFLLDRGERLDTSFNRFKQTYFYPVDYQGYKWVAHDWAEEEILDQISDLVFRVSREDAGIELKVPIKNIVQVRLPPKAWAIYKEMEVLAFAEIRKQVVTAGKAAAKTAKLRQIAAGFIYDEDGNPLPVHSEKIKAVREIVDSTGSPVIVVYQFQYELEMLRKEFPEGTTFGRPGGRWEKAKNLASLQRDAWNDGGIPVLFLHPQSGGHGINLQKGGHTMVICSASYSLEQMDQVCKRLDRSGQKEAVVFHWIVVENSVDNLLMDVLEERSKDQTRVLELIMEYAHGKRKVDHSRGSGRFREVDPGREVGVRLDAGGKAYFRAPKVHGGTRGRTGSR